MPPRTEKAADKARSGYSGAAPIRTSKIPAPIRFPLLLVLSLTLSSLLYALTADYTIAYLAVVSRRSDEWYQVATLVGWKTFELALGWFWDYDGYDLAALSLLSHGPPLYLLGTFYEVSSVAVTASLVIDTLTTYIPFRLLRSLSPAHSSAQNDAITASISIQAYTTILAASIYSVTLFSAYKIYLPVYLVTYFDNIRTIAAAHNSSLVTLFPMTLALGLAAKSFIFTPAASLSSSDIVVFDPETATLVETFLYNIWGYSSRTRVVITRTATLMFVSGVNTFVQTFFTVEGVEATGAVAYSAVWVVAAGITGAALGLCGAA